ncbi:MAG: acyl-CoA dehydrogenase family protein [bacterium]|nr:acyl-CoA dehydrogenase family protein [bacterium]MDE0288605.1 acyl-CoA dehydrogenase family protein [bacterium]MDE0439567.1 acyl-CoA dehydrogenase family protein [bacterium]
MNFGLTGEQRLIVDVACEFTERELFPYEEEVDRSGLVPPELVDQIRSRAITAGIYAANMPVEYGGAGLDPVTLALVERELGAASYALQYIVARPSNILRACKGDQIERYLLPTIRGDRVECLAMSEPDAGSDLRGMKCSAVPDGTGYTINGTKHFISHADLADYVILFAATGEEAGPRGPRKLITAFLVDIGTPGFEVRPGYRAVSNRGYHNFILNFDGCRVQESAILGEEHQGFAVANLWLGSTRLQVAAVCLGRARRAIRLATAWAVDRTQFGKQIGKFQGVSFKLADMQTRYEAAELLTLRAAWKEGEGTMSDTDAAMAKLYASEMCQFVTDEAIQIFGGMGLMDELPLERLWRDTRVDRIWDGTSEIQRHIISRSMLRPLGG